VRKSKIKQIFLAVCLALMPFSIYATGLGKLNVSSGLGEPLRAEIELLSVSPEELSTLVASIASEEAYVAQGITRLGIHNSIKVDLSKNTDGSPVLKLRSNQPISDPYLDVLIQVDWATGRLQREYTILLDPPGYKPSDDTVDIPVKLPSVSSSNNNVAPSNNVSANAMTTDQSNGKKIKKVKKQAVQVTVPQNEATDTVAGQEVTTKRGDTLSSVARDLQVEGVSLDQMIVGLYENNQEAFASGNMNRLKVGQIIKVPTKESFISISPQEARKTVKVHSSNWNAYRNHLAKAVTETPAMVENEKKQSASGKITTAEDKATPPKAGPKDVVKLSAGDKSEGKAADAKIVALQEEATAREKALKEAEERTLALEKQIADMQKLLALKNQSMTELQKNAEATTMNVAKDKLAKAEAAKAELAKAEAAKAELAKAELAKAEAAKAEAAKAELAKAEADAVAKAQEAEKVKVEPVAEVKPAEVVKPPVVVKKKVPPKVVVSPPMKPVEEPSMIDGIMNAINPTMLGGALGVGLLGVGWMFLRNKRRKDLDSFERGILTSGGLRANTVFGNTTGSTRASDTSFLTDFVQSADGSMIDTNDVDPIAEAEVYMAYGRDAQAEEILKDAISKEPKRYELHLKLLEMYVARKDTSAFEAIAGELYTTLGADNPTWGKVAELGASLEPNNPLYDLSKIAATTSLTTQKLDATEATQKLDVADFANVAVSTSANLDFSLDGEIESNSQSDANSVVMQSFTTAANVEQEVSFELGAVDATALENDSTEIEVQTSLNESQEVIGIDTDNLMDFDLGEFVTETPAETVAMNVTDELPVFDTTLTMDNAIQEKAIDSNVINLSAMSESSAGQSPDMDINFDLAKLDSEIALEQNSGTNTADDISFDLDFVVDTPSQFSSTEVQAAVADLNALEISFDLPSIEESEVAVVESSSQSKEFEVNTFDLSSISLDLGEAENELTAVGSVAQVMKGSIETDESADISSESPDVNIKLDLVAAYIDMDDKEGARELLEEVIKEGGTQQKLRAQQLIDSLA
jgi:pilus assembly protein FimV